ncbi:ATP-binding protein [Nocardioides daejeonensis]|uniref:ATP-binding protein n=1 Tax=Nocardioides daejeonensis TaxID=1046556 RepID=UPI000D74B7D0|nr:ATP-binding protein [Nocardioides daejeonensis]
MALHRRRLAAIPLTTLAAEGIRRLRYPRGEQATDGWATASLERSIRTALLVGMAGWQGALVLSAFTSLGWTPLATGVAAAHAACLLLSLATLRCGWNRTAVVASVYATFLLDWNVAPSTDSVLLFAAWWMVVLAHAYVLDGRWWRLVPGVALLVVPATMVATRPDWPHILPLSFAVFLLATTPSARVGLSFIIDYTHDVDREAKELESALADLEARGSARKQVAEDARVLHDTAINTLGAIANGGSALDDHHAVRRRCLDDVEALELLRASTPEEPPARERLRDAARPSGIRVRHSGMPDDSIAQLEALLPAPVVRAFGRATAEAVQNAAKHSGSEEVTVTVDRRAGLAVVEIRDDGRGTDAALRPEGGVQRSILDRAREVGITASFDSAPGKGTTVRMTYPLSGLLSDGSSVAVESVDAEELLREVRARASALVLGGLIVVATSLALFNHQARPTPEWLMPPLVAWACWMAWRVRSRPRLPRGTAVILLVAGPAAYLASAWSVGFGQEDPLLWQAVAPVGPTLALVLLAASRATRILALMTYFGTGLAVAAAVAPRSTDAALINVAAATAGVGVVLGVAAFMSTLTAVVRRASRDHQERFAIRVETAAVDAADEARRRWRQAGLDQSVDLLRAIGEGRMSPHDPDVQTRCGNQEHFLRQLTTLDPQLTRMGTWFAHALSAASERGIGLTVRSGATDAGTEQAGELGPTLLSVIGTLPRGTTLTTSLFVTGRGLVMTLVAPTPLLADRLAREARNTEAMSVQSLGGQDLVEITFDLTDPPVHNLSAR